MAIALWIVLLVCVVWIALSEMPVGWDGHLPLPYLIALAPLLWIPTLAIVVAGIATHDTALDEAKGRRATFPSWIPWPRLILDHVLFTAGLDASDVRSFMVNGTDHLALAATLTLK